MVLKMISKNVTDRTLRGFIMQEDAINEGLARILSYDKEFVRDLITKTLGSEVIPKLKKKERKDFRDYVNLGIYYMFEGEVYDAQVQFQEALRLSNNELNPSLRTVSSNIGIANINAQKVSSRLYQVVETNANH